MRDIDQKMRRTYRSALGLASILMLSCVLPASAQSSSGSDNQPPAENSQQKAAGKNAKKSPNTPPSAAQENPFPADVSEHAAQQKGSDSQSTNASAPDAPTPANAAPQAPATPPAQKPGDAVKENPFPEDVSRAAASAASRESGAAAADASGVNSSSSSSAGGDPGGGDPNADIPRDAGRHRLHKPSPKDVQSGSLAGEGRAADDIKVGKYYYNDGNYQGAYARFSEAAQFDPANLEAIYGLALAAEKLHRKDEALANYKLYLDAAPDGKDAKSARKAMEQLNK